MNINRNFVTGTIVGAIVMIAVTAGLIQANIVALASETIAEHDHDYIQCYDAAETASTTSHTHSSLELTDDDIIPTIEIQAFEDPVSGYNLQITLTNFSFSPESAGLEHVAGEGHAHLYVDGVKVGRVYSEWVHVANLSPGLHEIKVTLNTNDHASLVYQEQTIVDQVVVSVEA